MGEYEVQVALLGGKPNVAIQASTISALAGELENAGLRVKPHRIGRLADVVVASELPESINGLPVLGVANETLAPLPWYPEGCLLITGSVNSGRTETLAGMVNSFLRAHPGSRAIRLAANKSRLTEYVEFTESYQKAAQVAPAASAIADQLEKRLVDPKSLLVVIEGAFDLEQTEAGLPLQTLVKVCSEAEVPILAGSDSGPLSIYGALMQLIAAPRHGVAVQPDSLEGDKFFRTSFPPIGSREYPANRALYVRKGVVTKVQTAVPG